MEQTINTDSRVIAIISSILLLLLALAILHINHTMTFTSNSAAVEVLQWSSDTCWVKW